MCTIAEALIKVPATSANLGPGFDALGLALTLYDEVTVEWDGPADGLRVEVTGEGAAEVPRDETHLVVRSMRAAFERLGVPGPAGLTLRCHNRIPHGRGLGSSAAAICAGLLAAQAVTGAEFDVFALAAELEGHPDNVAACLAGGLTIAWTERGEAKLVRLTPDPRVIPVVCVPATKLSTHEARGLLPQVVPHRDAAVNAGRAALLIAALTSRPDLLPPATEDLLHQNYRSSAMPATADLVRRLREEGFSAVVSGAGPTVMAFTTTDSLDSLAPKVGTDWHIQPLNIDLNGAVVQFSTTR
ncbi:homoserine kinase [Rhizohabitans arisaemae]|uniref:homoserine kinase n=1 Tax=Rhizohabitans arisaemae TaxID=2720610 RepID=UPI0024B262C0|nr:homoserine kinase [Rhizohabitans arisaemae]